MTPVKICIVGFFIAMFCNSYLGFAQEEDLYLRDKFEKEQKSSEKAKVTEFTPLNRYPHASGEVPPEEGEWVRETEMDSGAFNTITPIELPAYSPGIVTETDTQSAPEINPAIESHEETEESILSFNFLYYLIQKFKASEVID
ncbi:MAG: hypothetical protein OEX02_18925 [Cyclobacteriaceae bacterium]|nr:hypothetical protein [Cyclobacteriaceae bacterium]